MNYHMRSFLFHQFKIKGFKFYLYGSVNPWVLLASGEVKEISDELAKGKKLGDEVEGGILVGIKGTGKTADGSAFVKALGESAQTSEGLAKNAKRFEDLKSIQDLAARNAKILQGGKGVARDPNFRKNFFSMVENYGLKLSENAKKFIAVHHIAPNFLKGNKKIADFITHMGYNIDAVENAIGLPRIDLNLLDDAIKGLDESINMLKNTQHLESIKTTLKLGDDVDIKELRRIVKELEDIKTASVHAVDTYHPAFNKMMRQEIEELILSFDNLIKSGVSQTRAIEAYKPIFNNLINMTVNDLLNGIIKL